MKVYTYHENIEHLRDDALLGKWRESWAAHGWEPVVLDSTAALGHPLLIPMLKKAEELPTVNDLRYETACYVRWVAIANQGGGLMTDADMINYGFTPEMLLATIDPNVITVCDGHVPSCVYGTQEQFEAFVQTILDFEPNGLTHVSDLIILSKLDPQGNDAPRRISKEYGTAGWKVAPLVHYTYERCGRPKSVKIAAVEAKRAEPKKLKFIRETLFSEQAHRFGWNRVLAAMRGACHSDNGMLCDDFVDGTFLWHESEPYREPWVGFLHNPASIAEPFDTASTAATLLMRPEVRESMKWCSGLFTFSKSLADQVKRWVPCPVEPLIHPTETNVPQWDAEAFEAAPSITHIGWWLRRFESFHLLDVPFKKLGLISEQKVWPFVYARATQLANIRSRHKASPVEWPGYLAPEDYDAHLAKTICFLDLIDASANNVVVECLASATPLLVNPLPAVVEYLGEDYPFYFLSLDEAREKAADLALILEAHAHMKANPIRAKLTYAHFLQQLQDSALYKTL